MILVPSAVSHALWVLYVHRAGLLAARCSLASVQTILPCPGASDQKSTPSTFLIFCLSSMPSAMTSPWQNQSDFWWTWSDEPPSGTFGSIGQARVSEIGR